MADTTDNDLTINPGTGGANIATDWDGTRHFQVQKVAYGDSTATQRVDATHPLPITLKDSSGTAIGVSGGALNVNLSTSGSMNVNLATVTNGTAVPVYGVSGGTAIAITAGNFHIRGLSAGSSGGTGPLDSVSVQGVSGAFPIPVSGISFSIRGLTSGSFTGITPGDAVSVQGMSGGYAVSVLVRGLSGATTMNPIGASGSKLLVNVEGTVNVGNTLGVTAGDFDIRDLSMGTPASGLPSTFDGVRVAGYSGGFPVSSLVHGMSGATMIAIGVTGSNRLMVDIGIVGLSFGGTLALGTSVGITGPVFVRGSTTADVPLWVAGGTQSGALILVGGTGISNSVLVSGTTNGYPVGITASNFQIRGLTASDVLGLTGAAYASLLNIYNAIFASGASPLSTLLNSILTKDGEIKLALSNSTITPGVLEALKAALANSNFTSSANSVRATVINPSAIDVTVSGVTMPAAVANNSVAVTTSAVQFGSQVLKSGARVKAHPDNTDVIYLGSSNAVTSANGYPLAAGEDLFLEIGQLSLLWAIAGSGSQVARWIGS